MGVFCCFFIEAIPLLVYGGLTVLSTALSVDKDLSLKGNVAAVWKGHEKALFGRGYIWGRTIPLILKHLIWGSSPDTFAAEFPQTDYVMKANTGAGMYQQLPTKAHSLYLQTALQTGVLSLLCLMLFWRRYLFCFIKTFFGNENKAAGRIKLAVFLGIAVEKIN